MAFLGSFIGNLNLVVQHEQMFPSTGSGLPFPNKCLFKAMGAITFRYTVINLVRNIFLQNVEDEMYK